MPVPQRSTESKRRRLLLATLIIALVAVIGLLALWNLVAPRYAVEEMKKAMATGCVTCRLAIDHPHLGFVPGSAMHFDDVSFYGGERGHSDVQVMADSVEVQWHPLALLHHQLVISSVSITNPYVVLSEGDLPSRFKKGEKVTPDGDGKPSAWTFEVDHMAIEGATFIYRRVHDGKKGELHVTQISATASRWGTTSDELHKSVGEAIVHGQIEKSGHGLLRIAMPVLEVEKQHIDVDLTVDGLKLDELTYLPACEGVSIKGEMVGGHGQVFIRDRKYNAKTRIEYKDLDVKLETTKTQSEVVVFFVNLAADLLLRTKNLDKTLNQQTRETDGKRFDDESIAHFILRGFKESAMKVAAPQLKAPKEKPKK